MIFSNTVYSTLIVPKIGFITMTYVCTHHITLFSGIKHIVDTFLSDSIEIETFITTPVTTIYAAIHLKKT